jgi:ubiquinone/menaquinone biosynthesis C-methylase UbiE
MTTNYDPIAEQYQRSKQQPWRLFIECYTLLDLIGNPQGLNCLDIACGEGFYTRLIRQRGASRVSGVDLSPGMIELAKAQEAKHRLGIEYFVADARTLPFVESFDLAVAAYLLNYATNADELLAMCQGIARALKPGGRFVTVNCNPTLAFPSAPHYRPYGFETSTVGEWKEGAPITWTFYLSDGPFSIENYHLSVATHETALKAAGFRDVRWHTPRISPAGLEANSMDFWQPFLNKPPITFIECVK